MVKFMLQIICKTGVFKNASTWWRGKSLYSEFGTHNICHMIVIYWAKKYCIAWKYKIYALDQSILKHTILSSYSLHTHTLAFCETINTQPRQHVVPVNTKYFIQMNNGK
jgi:hypothetical protein